MPEIGGKGLAADIRAKVPAMRQRMEGLRTRAAAAVMTFHQEALNVERAVKQVEDEAAEMAQIANEILGNEAAMHDEPAAPENGARAPVGPLANPPKPDAPR